MTSMIKIQYNKKIFKSGRVFIIAEIGINHEGNFNICKKMILEAKKAGADAVKIQTIDISESYLSNTKSFQVFKKKSFTDEELLKLNNYSKKLRIIFFTTAGDLSSLKKVKNLNFPAIKISSGLFNNLPLIEQAVKLKKPMILSCGMANFNEIKKIINFTKKKNKNLCLLKCTSLYPASDDNLNLDGILKLKDEFNIPIGYSDHTKDFLASILAVGLGATILEKHFTLNKSLPGGDHHLSLEPKEFKEYVKLVRRSEKMKGNKYEFPSLKEKKNRKNFHRYLVSKVNIKKNTRLSLNKLNFMRIKYLKGSILAFEYKKYIKKKINKNIKSLQIIKKKDFVK
jgi:N,N'-diacetyllegionaminate synthase